MQFGTGLQPGEGLPMWKSDTSDGPESHQNSNVPKSVAGLNGKQKFSSPPPLYLEMIENRDLFPSSRPLASLFSHFLALLCTPFAILFGSFFSFAFFLLGKWRRSFPDYRRTSQFDSVESAVGYERNHSIGRETAGRFLQRQGSSPVRSWGL